MTEGDKTATPSRARRLAEIKVTPLVVVGFIGLLALFSMLAMGMGLFAQHLHHLH